MSFFHEPPPLDSDIPPPLDDKVRDNEFDLDEEIIEDNLANNCIELPDLPTDFNVFSSAATDENVSYSHPPPELTNLVIPSSPPPDVGISCDKQVERDVAKEKESLSDVSQVLVDQMVNDENSSETNSPVKQEENTDVEDTTICGIIEDDEICVKTSEVTEDFRRINLEGAKNEENVIFDNDAETVEVTQSAELAADDDDFDDFVSGVEIESKIEKANDLEFSKFVECAAIENIPGPELKLDDLEEDEFNDFESAKVDFQPTRISSLQTVAEAEPHAVQFEADFSSFNAFSDANDDSSFNDFQESKSSEITETKFDSQLQNLEDDDDFGDFSDFTQAPATFSSQPSSVAVEKPADVNGILDMMFPTPDSCSENSMETMTSDFKTEEQVIKSDSFVNKFNDFDSTLALGYLYNSSKASQTLVKALGIDTRNILLGPQWASSASSNMPRFAANMSFNPIEPLKPLHTPTEPAKSAVLQPVKAKSDAVPEVEFDWNSAGLINPLDGPQPKPQQPLEPIHVQQLPETTPSFSIVDQEVSQVFEAEAKADPGYKPDLNEVPPAYQWSNESQQHHLATSNILVRERTIKLPETHIFTPVKGTSPIAREVVSREVSPVPDDPYYPVKGSIVVKEYHDVEYSLEPKKKTDPDVEFDDFQSAQPTVTTANPILLPLNLLEPQKVEAPSTEIIWPEPGVDVQFSNDLDFLETEQVTPASQVKLNPPLPPEPVVVAPAPVMTPQVPVLPATVPIPVIAPAPVMISKEIKPEGSKPILGTSPTHQNSNDDDFNDFQAAPVMKPTPKAAQLGDPITLSPARLAAQQANQKPTWINAMDDDEVSRIEAAFPKCKVEKKSVQNDEDDWSDFVAAKPAPSMFANSQPSLISSNNMTKYSNGDGDDWSDFVSAPPPISKIPSAKSSGAISSQLQSKPNFSSWSQPIGKHQYVNHSTSFLTNEPRNQNQQFTSNNYPYVTDKFVRSSITITDNFNYNFNHPEIAMGSIGSFNSHQQQQKKPNGISTVLPDLDFAMPKNAMGLSRSGVGHLDPGKK